MQKIAVVATGGTISSVRRDGIISLAHDGAANTVFRQADKQAYEVFQPFAILSENAVPQTWCNLYTFLRNLPLTAYAGVIVLHGTDTLAYTCAAVGIALCDTPVPIVFVSADYAPDHPWSNASVNFHAAEAFIHTAGLCGVFAVYQNDDGQTQVHLATRLLEADDYRNRFESYSYEPLGCIEQGQFHYNAAPVNPPRTALESPRELFVDPPASFAKRVVLLKAYPGLAYGEIGFSAKPAAILHLLYHSATGCVIPGVHSLPAFIARSREQGIPSYFCPARTGEVYTTTKEILNAGGIGLPNMASPAAYVKLLFAYNQTQSPPAQLLAHDFYYETLPPYER